MKKAMGHLSLVIILLGILYSGTTFCMHKPLRFAKGSFSTYILKNLAHHFKLLDQNKKNNLLIFMGPPASGKGSISKLCVDLLGWQHIATGGLCREQISEKTPLGKQIDLTTRSGSLIDDNLILTMVEKSLKKSFAGNTLAILDGLPRTLDQATKLDSLLYKKFENVQTQIVQFVVSDDFVIEYATNRLICPHCKAIFVDTKHSPSIPKIPGACDFCSGNLKQRKDDTPKVVQKRLDEYRRTENLLLNFYAKKNQRVIPLSMESTPNNPLRNQFDDFKNELRKNNGDL